jgi:inosine-uridine nucleoside N-ribohydrolase
VIIDTDVDFDDYLAILYLLKHPKVEVMGITVTGVGAVHRTPGVQNTRNLLTLLDEKTQKIPVCGGANAPTIFSNMFPYDVRQAADNHFGVAFPGVNRFPEMPMDAVSWLKKTVESAERPLSFLLIGGGTNFACLMDAVPREILREKIHCVVMMGGALPPHPGNIRNPFRGKPFYLNSAAEWNIFIDPGAANEVFHSGLRVDLVTLNACDDVPVTQEFVNRLKKLRTGTAQFAYQILTAPDNVHGIDGYFRLWDPLAACVLTDPRLVDFVTLPICVNLELDEEEDCSGGLVVDAQKGARINTAVSARTEAVYDCFLDIMKIPD